MSIMVLAGNGTHTTLPQPTILVTINRPVALCLGEHEEEALQSILEGFFFRSIIFINGQANCLLQCTGEWNKFFARLTQLTFLIHARFSTEISIQITVKYA